MKRTKIVINIGRNEILTTVKLESTPYHSCTPQLAHQ